MVLKRQGRILSLACLLLAAIPMFGQTEGSLKIADYRDSKKVDSGLRQLSGSKYSVGVRFEKFLNANYVLSRENDLIKSPFGLDFSVAFNLFRPVELEFAGFYSVYEVLDRKTNDYVSAGHGGLQAFLRINVLPYIGKISEYVYPYVAIGYETSGLTCDKLESKKNTSGALFKAGTRVRVSRNLFLFVDYQQGLAKKSDELYRAWGVGIGFNY